MAYWCENPDGSFLWLQTEWKRFGLAAFENCYQYDVCRYGTPWPMAEAHGLVPTVRSRE